MTIEEIYNRLEAIEAMAHDSESAHTLEDRLYRDFVSYVATLDSPLALKAATVVRSGDINFERWCL